MRLDLIVGARPNLMKAAPLWHAVKWAGSAFKLRLVHTGQHYDHALSTTFFDEFGLPTPDVSLGVGSGTHAAQTAKIMARYEPLLTGDEAPELVIVVGDVNSTVAAALTAKKANIKVAHLEAGLRSGDRSMPEEINRLVVDAIADVLWTPSEDADENLQKEGHSEQAIRRVGNIMIDAYEMLAPRILACKKWQDLCLRERGYIVVTFHRPSNVDSVEALTALVEQLGRCSSQVAVVFVVHPRTLGRLEAYNLLERLNRFGVITTGAMGYIEFMSLVSNCRVAVTDSGGVQEETTYLGVPCLTVRSTTERPITVTHGTNRLVSPEDLTSAVETCLQAEWPSRPNIPLWDGKTSERIVEQLRCEV
jgi:UDP-N-acetylglucosamine 2-epimerase (non-hydrolysing)